MPKRTRTASKGKAKRTQSMSSFNTSGTVTNKRKSALDPSSYTVSNSPLKRFAGLAGEALAWGATLAYQYPPLLMAKFAYQAIKGKSLGSSLTNFDKAAIGAYATGVSTIFGGGAGALRAAGRGLQSVLTTPLRTTVSNIGRSLSQLHPKELSGAWNFPSTGLRSDTAMEMTTFSKNGRIFHPSSMSPNTVTNVPISLPNPRFNPASYAKMKSWFPMNPNLTSRQVITNMKLDRILRRGSSTIPIKTANGTIYNGNFI